MNRDRWNPFVLIDQFNAFTDEGISSAAESTCGGGGGLVGASSSGRGRFYSFGFYQLAS